MNYFCQIDGTGYTLLESIPNDCVNDCSAIGACDEAVKFWSFALNFNAPKKGTREYLKSFGAWGDDELSDHNKNLERLLWIVCGDIAEQEREENRYESYAGDDYPDTPDSYLGEWPC